MPTLYPTLVQQFLHNIDKAQVDGSGKGFFVDVSDDGDISVGFVVVGSYGIDNKPASTLVQRNWLVQALTQAGIRAWTHGHAV